MPILLVLTYSVKHTHAVVHKLQPDHQHIAEQSLCRPQQALIKANTLPWLLYCCCTVPAGSFRVDYNFVLVQGL